MTQFLPSVPQTWWPGNREEPIGERKPTEPSVTANMAAVADAGEMPTDEDRSADKKAVVALKRDRSGRAASANGSVTTKTGGRVSPASTENEQTAAVPDVEAVAIHHGHDDGEAQLERLKAALKDDARRSTEPNRTASLAGDARLRVDSLLSRARRLFDVGRLSEARHTAQVAQELGETARLDYSPEEERPIDLVHRIDDQLQSMQEPSDEVGTEARDVADAERSKIAETPTAEAKTIATESTGSRSWLGRGMSVFRRDRKTGAADTAVIPAAADNAPLHVVLSLELDGDTATNADSRAAVVQANRSVALSKVTSPQSAGREPARFPTTLRGDGGDAVRSSPPSDDADAVASEFPESGPSPADENPSDRLLDNRANLSADGGPQLTTDDTATSPPTLEDVRPVSPFHNVATQTKAASSSRSEHVEPRDTIGGWAAGSVCLMACSLLALTCYRRGAT